MSEIADALLTQWTQFKVENDARLKEIEKFGAASAETSAKVDRLNDAIDELQTRANRPQMPALPQDGKPLAFQARLRDKWATPAMRNAAMQIATAEGTDFVPIQYASDVSMGLQAESLFRPICPPVVPMSSHTMAFPTLTNSTAAILTPEEGNVSEVEPSTGTITAHAYRYTKLVKAARELVADTAYPLWEAVLAPDFAHAFALAENLVFTSGAGTDRPQGILVGGTASATAAAVAAITADEVINLFYSLDHRHRASARCRWMANDATFKQVRKFVDANGNYLWQPGLQSGQPDRLMGVPAVPNSDMAAPASNKKVLVIGDFDFFKLFERDEMRLQVLVELYAYTGQVGYLSEKRFDGRVMLATAFQYLTTKT